MASVSVMKDVGLLLPKLHVGLLKIKHFSSQASILRSVAPLHTQQRNLKPSLRLYSSGNQYQKLSYTTSSNCMPFHQSPFHEHQQLKALQYSVNRSIASVTCHTSAIGTKMTAVPQAHAYHTVKDGNIPDTARELKITFPNGYMAGKVWNESAPVAVLCLHGWQDNAGTFDHLAPLLPAHLCLVAVDFPGHGLSSHKPSGFCIPFTDYVMSVDRMVRHYGWKKVVILGHSMGAAVGMLYAGTRPNLVHTLVMMDLIKPISTEAPQQPERTEAALDALHELEEKLVSKKKPCYSYEELLKRAMKSHEGSLRESGVRTLLQRGSCKLPDGRYSFTYDLQIRSPSLMRMSLEQQLAYAARLKCRLLVMKAEGGPYYESKESYQAILDQYKKSSAEFQYLTVPGTHHTHLDTPEHVVPHLQAFLSQESLGGLANNVSEDGGDSLVTRVDKLTALKSSSSY